MVILLRLSLNRSLVVHILRFCKDTQSQRVADKESQSRIRRKKNNKRSNQLSSRRLKSLKSPRSNRNKIQPSKLRKKSKPKSKLNQL